MPEVQDDTVRVDGQTLRFLMEKAKVSVRRLADAAGVNASSVQRWRNSEGAQLAKLGAAADVLGVRVTVLVDDGVDPGVASVIADETLELTVAEVVRLKQLTLADEEVPENFARAYLFMMRGQLPSE